MHYKIYFYGHISGFDDEENLGEFCVYQNKSLIYSIWLDRPGIYLKDFEKSERTLNDLNKLLSHSSWLFSCTEYPDIITISEDLSKIIFKKPQFLKALQKAKIDYDGKANHTVW